MSDFILLFNFSINFIIVTTILIFNFVSYFHIKVSNLDIVFYTYESSPLFDFDANIDCGKNSHIIFHVWEGRMETHTRYDKHGDITSFTYHDKTNIDKINGKLFCFKNITYKELLYNGQIIKNGEDCPDGYEKNCGIIDTIGQNLCIKKNEKCPLYDIGIGEPKDTINYYYDDEANIYYNNDKYNGNKTIIGTLILNDGQPCYDIKEKLWRKFDSCEIADSHLKCKLEVFGKLNDDRYENKGSITYKMLYKDNLPINSKTLLLDKIKDEKVSLYKRIFIGIDKKCDENSKISKNKYDKLKKNQSNEKKSLLAEAIIILLFVVIGPFYIIKNKERYIGALLLFFLLFLIFIICHSVFLGKIIHFRIFYNCSDSITNEMFRKENQNIKNIIIFSSINLGFEVLFIFVNILFLLFDIIKDCDCLKKSYYPGNHDSNTNKSNVNKNNSNVYFKNKPNIGNQEKPVGEANNDKRFQENQLNQTTNNNNQNTDVEVFPQGIPAPTSKENI